MHVQDYVLSGFASVLLCSVHGTCACFMQDGHVYHHHHQMIIRHGAFARIQHNASMLTYNP
jgi:hypothetical protein